MKEPRTLLLASDLSARSDRPTDRAMLLGDQLSASVLLLHVVEDHDADDQLLKARARQALESVAGEHASRFEIVVRQGRVDRQILSVAEKSSAVLIITGAARFNNIRDYFLGTAVDHLVRHSSVPVLVVKRRARGPYRRLMVATDFSEYSTRALETAGTLFPDAEITVWHSCHAAYEGILDAEQTAIAVQLEADRDMERFIDKAVLPTETRRRLTKRVDIGRDLWNQAAKAIHDDELDLLVLGTHGRGVVAHASIGSRAAELLQCVDCDTLVVRQAPP